MKNQGWGAKERQRNNRGKAAGHKVALTHVCSTGAHEIALSSRTCELCGTGCRPAAMFSLGSSTSEPCCKDFCDAKDKASARIRGMRTRGGSQKAESGRRGLCWTGCCSRNAGNRQSIPVFHQPHSKKKTKKKFSYIQMEFHMV